LFFFLNSTNFVGAASHGCGDWLRSASVPDGETCDCDGASWQGLNQPFTFLFNIPGTQLLFKNRAVCCGWVQKGTVWDQCLSANPTATSAFCGDSYTAGARECICGGGATESVMRMQRDGTNLVCCGWLRNGVCQSTDVGINDVEVSEEMLNSLNPLAVGGGTADLSTPGKIISRALAGFIFPIAGIILFVQLLLGGFQMLTGAAAKGMDEGKQKITSALIGFIILFAAYWIAQLLELIFGIRILS
jgi:hypothetical protein